MPYKVACSMKTLVHEDCSRTSREEDQSPTYDPKKYYPARIGETISDKYRLISKLGWDANSITWLAKDIKRWKWQSNQYATIKITNYGEAEQESAQKELEILRHISRLQASSAHKGRRYVQTIKDCFRIQGAIDEHLCLVYEPMREPLSRYLSRIEVPPAVLKPFLKPLLLGLDFLHSECRVIHTDLTAESISIGFENTSLLDTYTWHQEQNPAPFKTVAGHPIYQSRSDFGPLRKPIRRIQISNFTTAVFGNTFLSPNHQIQSAPFSAPEVLLKASWSYAADIWNLGALIWDLLANTALFTGRDPLTNIYCPATHLTQIIRLLGPIPKEMIQRAHWILSSALFSRTTENTSFSFSICAPREEFFTFESRVMFVDGEEKMLLIAFARRILKWIPEERAAAGGNYMMIHGSISRRDAKLQKLEN
ncbi:kinase-like domain-containing protein [Aspergillus crustosus]